MQYLQNKHKSNKSCNTVFRTGSFKQDVRQGNSLSPLLFLICMNDIFREWSLTAHGGIPANTNLKLDPIVFADDRVILADSEYELQLSVYNLQNIAKEFNMEISAEETRIMPFQGKYPVRCKIYIYSKVIVKVNYF